MLVSIHDNDDASNYILPVCQGQTAPSTPTPNPPLSHAKPSPKPSQAKPSRFQDCPHLRSAPNTLFQAQKVLCVLLSDANGEATSARRDENCE